MRLRDIWWVIAFIAALGVLATTVSLWMGHPTADQDGWVDDVWLAVAEAGIQIVTVGVIGGALTAAWQAIARRREVAAAEREKKEAAQIERRDRIRSELAELVVLYNDVKAVRRTLRSLGLDVNLHVPDDDLGRKQREKSQARKEARGRSERRRREEQQRQERLDRELQSHRAEAGGGPARFGGCPQPGGGGTWKRRSSAIGLKPSEVKERKRSGVSGPNRSGSRTKRGGTGRQSRTGAGRQRQSSSVHSG